MAILGRKQKQIKNLTQNYIPESNPKGQTCLYMTLLTLWCSYILVESFKNRKKSSKFWSFDFFFFRRFLMIFDDFYQKHIDAFFFTFFDLFSKAGIATFFCLNPACNRFKMFKINIFCVWNTFVKNQFSLKMLQKCKKTAQFSKVYDTKSFFQWFSTESIMNFKSWF